jgi:hypothetical protein
VSLVCLQCADPPRDVAVGAPCPKCGGPLVHVALRTPEATDATLELEDNWKRANPVGHINEGQPKRSRTGTSIAVVLVLLVLGAGAAGAWWYVSHGSKPVSDRAKPVSDHAKPVVDVLPPTANTVSIRITASPPVEVTLDGKRAGKTPFTIHHARTAQPIVIGTSNRHNPFVEVIPDRDRDVDLSE